MKRGTQKRLAVERLEAKQMLAGDVTVSVVGGNLLIRGDDAANQISIASGEAENSFVIRGLDGTTVSRDGTTAPETGLVVENIRGVVNASMAAGDDVVRVSDAHFRRGLAIEMGAGDDRVNIGAAETPAALAEGEDANVTARGAISVFTGIGNDVVRVNEASVGGVLHIATGAGDDAVTLGEATAGLAATDGEESHAAVRAGLAIDVLLGEGADAARLNNVAARGAIVVGGGAGADEMSLARARAAVLLVSGGAGDAADVVNVASASARAAVIGTGGGADQVSIVDSTFTALEAALGAGDDKLSISGVTSRQALLAGGEGSADELVDAGNNAIGRKTVTGFEIPENVNEGRLPRGRDLLAGLLNRLRRA